jgi:hypothetical protein
LRSRQYPVHLFGAGRVNHGGQRLLFVGNVGSLDQ